MGLFKTESDIKHCYDFNLWVNASIFTKYSNFLCDLEIEYNGIFRQREYENRNERFVRCTLEYLNVDFLKIANLSANDKIGYVGLETPSYSISRPNSKFEIFEKKIRFVFSRSQNPQKVILGILFFGIFLKKTPTAEFSAV